MAAAVQWQRQCSGSGSAVAAAVQHGRMPSHPALLSLMLPHPCLVSRLFEETQRGLTRVTALETVHGSLLALGELLRHTGEDCGPLRLLAHALRGCLMKLGASWASSAVGHQLFSMPGTAHPTACLAASPHACPLPSPCLQASSCWLDTARSATPCCASATGEQQHPTSSRSSDLL